MAAHQQNSVARVVEVSNDAGSPGQGEAVEARKDAPAAQTAASAPAPGVPATPEKKGRRNFALPVIGLAVLAAGIWYGHQWWTDGRFLVSTDDAYVQGDIAMIAPKVSGYVANVNVKANQQVKAGDPLVTLDDGDYVIAVKQAEAMISTENLALHRIDAQIEGARASLAQTKAQQLSLEAAARGADINQKRASELQQKSVGTVASLDSAQVALDQANANLVAGQANIQAAEANIVILSAQRKEAESQVRSAQLSLDKAQRDLSFTVLRAPYDGIVGNVSVQLGDLVASGQRLAALVPVKQLFIEANFKETQLVNLVEGEKVRIHVDAFDARVIEGTVQSLAPASGSVFSMLPAENATGNFTKVVQRVPVRIAFPQEELERGHLRAGLSVVVDVDTRTAPEGRLAAQ